MASLHAIYAVLDGLLAGLEGRGVSGPFDSPAANVLFQQIKVAEERALAAEALVRAKDETIGELLELIPDGLGEGTWTRIDHLAAEDWRQYHEDIRLGRFS